MDTRIQYQGREWRDRITIDQEVNLPFWSRVKLLFCPDLVIRSTVYSSKILDGRQAIETKMSSISYWQMLQEKFKK